MKILINYADKQYEPARKWNTLTGSILLDLIKYMNILLMT